MTKLVGPGPKKAIASHNEGNDHEQDIPAPAAIRKGSRDTVSPNVQLDFDHPTQTGTTFAANALSSAANPGVKA